MEIKDLQNKLVAVLGYGREGKAVTAYLMKHGIKPVLFDQKAWKDWDEIEKLEIKKLGLNFIFGPDCFKELVGFDVAFRSPGVKISDISPRVTLGLRGLPSAEINLTSQTKWFFEYCPCKIIGVTGTKGKGTTASLIYDILSSNSQILNLKSKIFLTGNIGKIQPLEIIDALTADDLAVYELSSFQLQDLDRSPHIAVVLMTTSEHLDYHANQDEYVDAKSSITKFQTADDFAVINSDFENSMKIGELGKGKKIYFSRKRVDVDCFVKKDSITFVGAGLKPAPTETTLNMADLQLRGAHNLENVCAAVSVAKILNIDDNVIRDAVIKFKGLEHRLEFVAEKSGVKFYNDSFSTTPETAIAAVKSFTEPLIVVLGGSSKNADFTDLGRTIAKVTNIKALILIGEEAEKIKSSVIETLTPALSQGERAQIAYLEGAKNMEEIFEQVKSVAKKGDMVLLSPACASFDMFKSYVDRGEQFKTAVEKY